MIGEGIVIRNGTDPYRELEVFFKENHGSIIAEAPNTLVTIGSVSGWTNHGQIQVMNGTVQFVGNYSVHNIGDLDFSGGEVILRGNIFNEGLTIHQNASTGSWKFRGTVHGGRIETGDGIVADVGGQFEDVTLAGAAKTNELLFIRKSLIFDHGSLTIGSDLSINEHVVIEGEGEIVLNGTLIQTFNGGQVTFGPDIVVRTGPNGGGTISRGQLPVINQGTISAETPGKTLVVDGALTNTGLLQAKNNSTLWIEANDWTNEGEIHVENASVTLRSGTFTNGPDALITGQGSLEFIQTQFTNHGTISPGSSAGMLTFDGSVTLSSTSALIMELGRKYHPYDELHVVGDAIIDGELSVSLQNVLRLPANATYTILNVSGATSGVFRDLAESSLVGNFGGTDLFITYRGGDGNDVALFTEIPEPPSLVVLLGWSLAPVMRRRPSLFR